MEYGITILSIVPVRTNPGDIHEMCTQLLFGDHYTILEEIKNWTKIRVAFDDYEGWICAKQVRKISEKEFIQVNSTTNNLLISKLALLDTSSVNFVISIGSSLPQYKNGQGKIADLQFTLSNDIETKSVVEPKRLIEIAKIYAGAPYLWGGKSIFGIDCSGYSQMVYKICGIKIKRDASQQVIQGTLIKEVSESQPGDLAFFNNPKGAITHVGIILEGNVILHASGFVRQDRLDSKGIFNKDSNEYTHFLHSIKRHF
ncbi:MAG: C40 family peptidase [Flavobacteriales bacterium]|nr:C40 family peptidase [Flavobacteriales bacterium]